MKPHSLGLPELVISKTPAQKKAEAGWVGRHGKIVDGTVLPATQVSFCPRVKVADLPIGHLKPNHIAALEQNQKITSCCRHPEDHEVEALKSHPDEPLPDIYIFYCPCGKKHRFFCVGLTDVRPIWKATS